MEEHLLHNHCAISDIARNAWSLSCAETMKLRQKTNMSTAEEQWKIIQQEERRTGRGRRKKKTLTEQLREIGGFGHDPDSEQAIREDLERMDTRPSLQYSQESVSEREVSFGESSFWKSKKRLFYSWVFRANRSNSWIEEKDLPLFFRFALRRPIMDERTFQATLHAMDLHFDISMGDVRQPHTRPIGRARELMFGIDVDHERNVHVSNRFRDILPTGAAEKMDRVQKKATRMVQENDEDMQQLIRRQLWTVYEHVQNGSVPLDTATWHYRDAFNIQDLSDEALVICLQQFGIPTDHVPTDGRNTRRGSAKSPFSTGVDSLREAIGDVTAPDVQERKVIDELVNYIGLYRGGALQEDEVVPMIQHCLDGLTLEANSISDILTDLEKDEETAALLMWEDACYYNNTSSSEEENEGSYTEQGNPLRAVLVSHSHSSEVEDGDTVVASPVGKSNTPDGPSTEDMNHQDDFKENKPEQLVAMSIDQPLMSPPANLPCKLSMYSHVNETESTMQPPGTPRPKPVSLEDAIEECDIQADLEFKRPPPRDRADVDRRRTSSPENGMTTGIWGLLMPTKEARKLAYKLKLPQDTIDAQIRSIMPRRTKRRKASFAKTVVTFPKSKRKASMALPGHTAPKSPKHGDHSDLFAREGEDQEAFVLSHFERDAILLDERCMKCVRLPCECIYGSSPCSRSEPECSKCLQQPCMCGRPPRLDGTIPTAPTTGDSSSDALKPKMTDRTRPAPSKQSISLLDYLARVLDNDDVLASIKQLKRLSPTDSTINVVKSILDHIQQGICAGEKLDATGVDDREAMSILDHHIQSSQTLSDHSDKLHREATSKSTLNVDVCHDGVGKGPNLESSLLNSSSGNEHIPASPSITAASAIAFSETQSNIAKGAIFQSNNTPLAKDVSPYLPTPAPESNVLRLESSRDNQDAIQSTRFKAAAVPKSSAAGHPSRAESCTGSPPQTPLSSTADLSEQVSDHPVNAECDTDCDPLESPLMRHSYLNPRNIGNSKLDTRPSSSFKPGAKELNGNISPSSPTPGSKRSFVNIPPLLPGPPKKEMPKGTPPATPRPSYRFLKKMKVDARSSSRSTGFESLPLWLAQPGLLGKAGKEWMGMTPTQALDYAKKEAFNQRKSLAFYLEERRAVRTRIKKENDFANSKWSDHSFFQSTNGLSGSSGTATTPTLNKLFDKYRGTLLLASSAHVAMLMPLPARKCSAGARQDRDRRLDAISNRPGRQAGRSCSPCNSYRAQRSYDGRVHSRGVCQWLAKSSVWISRSALTAPSSCKN